MKKEIKDIFQKHYSETETYVDTDKLMKAIDAKRNPKKKRRWLILLPMGLLFPVAFYFLSGFSDVASIQNSFTEDKSELAKNVSDVHEAHDSNYDKNKFESTTKSNSTRQDIKRYSEEILTSEVPNIKSTLLTTELKDAKGAIRKKTTTNQLNHGNLNYKEIKETFGGYLKNVGEKPLTALSKLLNDQSDEIGLEAKNKVSSKWEISSQSESSTAEISEGKSDHSPLSALVTITSLIVHDDSQPIDLDEEHLVNVETPILANGQNKFSVKLLAGGLSYSQTRTALAEVDQELINEIDQKTSPFSSLDLNLQLEYRISQRIGLSTGVAYTRLSELFQWNGSYIADENGDYVTDVNEQEPQYSVVGFTTSEKYFEHVSRDIYKYNKTHLIDIPIALSYRILDRKFKVDLYAGAAFNLSKQASGYTLDSNLIPSLIQDKPAIGMNFNAGLEIGYELTHCFSALLRTEFAKRKWTTSIYEQNISRPSLKVGLSYSF